jgi:hypothetical protein
MRTRTSLDSNFANTLKDFNKNIRLLRRQKKKSDMLMDRILEKFEEDARMAIEEAVKDGEQ